MPCPHTIELVLLYIGEKNFAYQLEYEYEGCGLNRRLRPGGEAKFPIEPVLTLMHIHIGGGGTCSTGGQGGVPLQL